MSNHSYMSGNPDDVKSSRPKNMNAQSIVVLPFANLSGDADQEYFSDGFTEDLITELSRFREILVVSRNTSFAFKERNLDVGKIGRELGVTYSLEGTIRKMGQRVRVTVQLIKTQSGDHIWADKYDCTLDELFDVQDEIVSAIVSNVAAKIERVTRSDAEGKKPADMEAYDC